MEKFGGKVQTAALAALLAMGALALGLGGCKDAWRILTTGELYWEDDDGDEEEEKAVYAFRYDPSGGELYGGTPEGDIAEGETVTLPSSGGREGYTLTGFTLSGAAEGGFNPGDTFTMPAGEVTAAANWTQTFINLGDPQATTGAGWSYDEASGVFTISGGAGVEVRGSTARNRVVVRGTVTVTLSDANITSAASPFELESGANVTLKLAGSSSLVSTFNNDEGDAGFAGLQVESATLTIEGSGSLTAQGGLTGAGIGGRLIAGQARGGRPGTIIINSGTINATGGYGAAAIGGGYQDDGGVITISGGTVTAGGGTNGGAGIGGGNAGVGGVITISGGTVNATGGPSGAGIGGGYGGGGGNITISGGNGTATAVPSPGLGTGYPVGPGDAASGGAFNGVPDAWPVGPDEGGHEYRYYRW
jgi:hypothetical protein